ncbi:MAG: sulfotransferase family 2 domain-containing protein [Pseudomonadota bacterium]
MGSAQQINYHLHLAPRFKFIYFSNPKVGCSSIKATLNLAVAARRGQALAYTELAQVHDRAHGVLRAPRQVGPKTFEAMMHAPDVLRFSMFRDPVARVLSAYGSKLRGPRGRSNIAARLRDAMGWPEHRPIALEAFVEALVSRPDVLELDPHWRPQRRQIGYDVVNYSVIGDHANFEAAFGEILTHIFGVPVPVFDSRSLGSRRTDSNSAAEQLDDELRRMLINAYAMDYEMIADIRAKGLDRLQG